MRGEDVTSLEGRDLRGLASGNQVLASLGDVLKLVAFRSRQDTHISWCMLKARVLT